MNYKKLIRTQLNAILFFAVSILACSSYNTIQALTINNAYTVLGLDETASNADVKRAYQKLALKYHPDRNLTTDTTEKFQEIGRAYTLLKDRAPETVVPFMEEEETFLLEGPQKEITIAPEEALSNNDKKALESKPELRNARRSLQAAIHPIEKTLVTLHALHNAPTTLTKNEQERYNNVMKEMQQISNLIATSTGKL